MATVYPTAAGAWSTRTWNDDSTGAAYGAGTPQTGDTVLANNLAITVDVDITVAELSTRVGTTAAAGGGFTVSGTRTINANINAGTTDCLTIPSFGSNITVNGNVTGGSGTGADGIVYSASNSVLNVTGNVNSGSGSSALGINAATPSTSNFVVTGTVTGGSTNSTRTGIVNGNSGTGIIIGNVVAGASAPGVSVTTGWVRIQGNILPTTTAAALAVSSTGSVYLIGNAAANTTQSAISYTSIGQLIVVGDVTGGTTGDGINSTSNSVLPIVINGTITGGSSAGGYGISHSGSADIRIFGTEVAGAGDAAVNNAGSGTKTTVGVGGGGAGIARLTRGGLVG